MTIGRGTGKPALFFAAPLERSPGSNEPLGVIIAGLDLDWFARLSNRTLELRGQLVQLLDSRDGAVLVEAPDAALCEAKRAERNAIRLADAEAEAQMD